MFLIISILFASFLFSFAISHIFLSMFILRQRKSIKEDTFSFMFSLSNIMLLSMIIEISEIGESDTRKTSWKLIMFMFVYLMYYILPFYILKHTINENYTLFFSKIKICFSYVLYLLCSL